MKKTGLKKIFAGLSSVCMMTAAIPVIPAAVQAAAADPLYGDANYDGEVNMADAVIIMQSIANPDSYTLSAEGKDLADVNKRGDGVTNTDALSIQKYKLGLISSLPESWAEGNPDPVASETYIHLKNTSIEVEGDYAEVNGTTVTINHSGTFYVDGTLDDGQILVAVPDEAADPETVKIFLNGVNITGKSAPAIYVENAENTSVNLVEGTENTISDGDTAYAGDFLGAAVIEAKDDITFKGAGTLNITANTQYAVQCNNDIKFTSGTVNIETLLEDAVRGKTSVTVKETAVIDIDSEGDGIKSTKGDVAIEGGTVVIKAGNDAIQAETTIDISGGIITAGGDRGLTGTTGVNITGGKVIATATDNQTDTALLSATQGTMILNCIGDASNTEDGCWKKANTIIVNDSLTFVPVKKYMYVLISDASITADSVYNLKNGSTDAVVTHNNELDNVFAMTGTVSEFNTVNMNSTGGEVTTVTDYTITLSSASLLSNAPAEVASVNNNVCTITQPGVFAVSGEMTGGQIVVDVDKTAYPDGIVELDLMGVNLTNTADSPIYVASIGDEVQIVAKNGYENTISDGTSYTNADAGMGAIYSCDDLKIKGSGSLTVNGNAEDGIVCKNDLKLYNGNITVNAVDDAVRGKDSVTIGNDTDTDFSTLNITVNSKQGDGIKSTETDTTTGKGNVTVNGGSINVTAYSDGIHASQLLTIHGGDINIETTCPATSSGSNGSTGSWRPGSSSGTTTTDTAVSAKGLKAGATDDTTGTAVTGAIAINGGNISVNSTDDCIHASGNIDLIGGKMELSSGDDAVHSDADLVIGHGSAATYDDVTVIIYKGYEGMEGINVTQNSGTVISNTTDDGYNAAGGADGSGNTSPGGWGGGFGSTASGNYSLNIKGGFVLVNVADGDHDGFDSNGPINISGGIAVSNGQEAFDCGDGSSITYSGGVYVKDTGSGGMGGMGGMGGSTSMTESVSASGSVSAGTRITLTDGSGNVIVSFIADKSVSKIIAGCTAYSGASIYTGGTLSGATYFQNIDDTQLAAYGGKLTGGTLLK